MRNSESVIVDQQVSLVGVAIAVLVVSGVAAIGLLMLFSPERALSLFNRYLGRGRRVWPERLTRAGRKEYRISGAALLFLAVVMAAFMVGERPVRTVPSTPAESDWPVLGMVFLPLTAILLTAMVVDPRATARFLQWDRSLDPSLFREGRFYRTMRCMGILGLILLASLFLHRI